MIRNAKEYRNETTPVNTKNCADETTLGACDAMVVRSGCLREPNLQTVLVTYLALVRSYG